MKVSAAAIIIFTAILTVATLPLLPAMLITITISAVLYVTTKKILQIFGKSLNGEPPNHGLTTTTGVCAPVANHLGTQQVNQPFEEIPAMLVTLPSSDNVEYIAPAAEDFTTLLRLTGSCFMGNDYDSELAKGMFLRHHESKQRWKCDVIFYTKKEGQEYFAQRSCHPSQNSTDPFWQLTMLIDAIGQRLKRSYSDRIFCDTLRLQEMGCKLKSPGDTNALVLFYNRVNSTLPASMPLVDTILEGGGSSHVVELDETEEEILSLPDQTSDIKKSVLLAARAVLQGRTFRGIERKINENLSFITDKKEVEAKLTRPFDTHEKDPALWNIIIKPHASGWFSCLRNRPCDKVDPNYLDNLEIVNAIFSSTIKDKDRQLLSSLLKQERTITLQVSLFFHSIRCTVTKGCASEDKYTPSQNNGVDYVPTFC
ncbi:MAG: hypothetical protein HW387_817 [Parachlamydiales bacterium]|nr:hypothetical protein [Parachlamydiales bacterium]